MPPPNVTGTLHIGHALNCTIQDVLVRYHRQRGLDSFWQPGVDHAGIATQMVVTRDLEAKGIDARSLSKQELIDKIWEWKEKSGGAILEQMESIGCSFNADYSRFTMDDGFCRAVNTAFVRLYKDGLIFRDKRLVNWDTKFKTAISDLEIQNRDEKGVLWHIKYKFADSNDFVVIATTRPETMFGDSAVAVHPEDERYKNFVGRRVVIPYTGREIPVIADAYVDMEKGSGCLKVTPSHDFNDFAIGKRHGLEMISILDEDGHTHSCPDFINGMYVRKARKILVERLNADGLLVKEEEIVHSVPYGDRSGTVIEPMLTDQWFVDAKKLAVKAIEAVENGTVRFFPDKWAKSYFEWMLNIEPWCISRQIVWGHRIPAWFCEDGEIIVEMSEEEAVAAAAKLGKSGNLVRETDVLDTWFSSSLWSFATLGWPDETDMLKLYHPTSVLVTGFDIIFFWVARMMMMSLYFCDEVPFKNVYVHALVRDGSGQKMSKSKGNVIDPMDLINEYGADALRFTLTFMSVPGRDIKLDRENVKISRNFITKIWNAARFLQSKEVAFDSGVDVSAGSKLTNWLIAKLKKLRNDIDENFKEYRFDYASRNIQHFLRDVFCDFFIEAMKFQDDSETKSVAGFAFMEFLRISNPFIPFVTEHLADTLSPGRRLIVDPGFDLDSLQTDQDLEKEVDEFVDLIHEIRSEKQTSGGESENFRLLKERLDTWPGELNALSAIIR
jgi:valyl-tRNA synthetase